MGESPEYNTQGEKQIPKEHSYTCNDSIYVKHTKQHCTCSVRSVTYQVNGTDDGMTNSKLQSMWRGEARGGQQRGTRDLKGAATSPVLGLDRVGACMSLYLSHVFAILLYVFHI